jgi:3-oxoadipate enol-lactonase
MPRIKVNDINLYYGLQGPEEADVVVLSNGIFMSTASWGFQVAALKEHFRVLTYDCRGMWQSDHPAGPYSMELHADDLAGLLSNLGISRAHIAGISYGGEVSMTFAIKYPQMTRTLILSSVVSQIDPLLRAIGESWAAPMRAGDAGMLFDVTLPYNFAEGYIRANSAIFTATRARYYEMDLKSIAELMSAFIHLDLTPHLSRIIAPTLVMVGEEDNLKPRKYAEIIADHITGAELAVIPHAGHAVCLEQPGVFNDLMLGFILKHCSRSA